MFKLSFETGNLVKTCCKPICQERKAEELKDGEVVLGSQKETYNSDVRSRKLNFSQSKGDNNFVT